MAMRRRDPIVLIATANSEFFPSTIGCNKQFGIDRDPNALQLACLFKSIKELSE
jgi:hypothetical protein